MTIGIILQARMGSSRLPGKILKKIGNKTLLEHIFYRLKLLKHEVKLVLATSENINDDVVERFCKEKGIECFRGSEINVLERYYLCARKYGLRHIIRLTGDNPFTDVDELDNLIELHLKTSSDYTHSFGVLPVGIGAEIFTFAVLVESYKKATRVNHLEHVNEYIQEHPELFRITVLSVTEEKHRPDLRLTVDTEDDYSRACFIVKNSGSEYITTEEAIGLCSRYA